MLNLERLAFSNGRAANGTSSMVVRVWSECVSWWFLSLKRSGSNNIFQGL